jgi:hypothetical protein
MCVCSHSYAQSVDTLKPHNDSDTHVVIDSLKKDSVIVAKQSDSSAQKLTIDSTQKKPDTIVHTAPVSSGYIINGKVEDVNTSEGIPFATVIFPGSNVGMPADINGNFVLKTESLPGDSIRIQALGYKTLARVLHKGQHNYNFIIEMQRSSSQLGEFVLHSEGVDPALLLLKHIIEHKPQNNPDRSQNYRYEAYNRLELDLQRLTKSQFSRIPILKSYTFVYNDLDTVTEGKPFLPLYLTETISDYYFQRDPKKQREFIKGSMIKGVNNRNVMQYLGTLHQNVNVYKNNIPVLDKKYISPISDDGAFFYHYTIKDTEQAFGHSIILMQFEPRRPGENCFTGDFWVVDSVYALQRINMEVPVTANINWVDHLNIYQEFAPVNDTFWFCVKDKFIASFSAYNSNRLPGVIGRKTTTYHNIVLDDTATTHVLEDKNWRTEVIVNDSAKDRGDAWWANVRPDSLTQNEKKVYKMVDTINSMPVTTVYKNLITFLASGVRDVGPIQLGPYFYLYSSNTIEGNRYRISLGTPRKLKDEHFTGYLAYGDKDKEFKYGFTGLWLLDRKQRTYLYGTYTHDIDHTTNYYDQLGSDNIFSALVRKPGIPYKLAFINEETFEFFREYYSGFSHKLTLTHKQFTPYAPLPSAGIFVDNNGMPSNSVTNSEVQFEFRYAYKEHYVDGQYLRVNLGSKYPIVDLQIGIGIKNILNSGYNYQKARLSITEDVNIPPLGHIYYNLFAGKYFGTLPYPLLEVHPGNEYWYYNNYAFEMMNMYEFISDKYVGFNIEHNIGGGVFNYIPLLKKMKLRQFWTAKGVIGGLSSENELLNFNKGYDFRSLQNNPYIELGTGISNIFQIFRVDFVWRVNPALQPNEPKSRYFGIFGSVRFAF